MVFSIRSHKNESNRINQSLSIINKCVWFRAIAWTMANDWWSKSNDARAFPHSSNYVFHTAIVSNWMVLLMDFHTSEIKRMRFGFSFPYWNMSIIWFDCICEKLWMMYFFPSNDPFEWHLPFHVMNNPPFLSSMWRKKWLLCRFFMFYKEFHALTLK